MSSVSIRSATAADLDGLVFAPNTSRYYGFVVPAALPPLTGLRMRR
ncbi:hypothetical protein ACWF0M_00670 [Kribbella sp. NPDC055110]